MGLKNKLNIAGQKIKGTAQQVKGNIEVKTGQPLKGNINKVRGMANVAGSNLRSKIENSK